MLNDTPPKYWLRVFKWFCDPDLHPFIEGDLFELYSERLKESGKKKADRRFAWDVILLFRPGIIRSFRLTNKLLNQHDMLRNYLKVAWRNLLKQRLYALINIAGLTLGMSCFILLLMYVQDELSYDQHLEDGDRMYRVHMDLKSGETFDISIKTPAVLKPTLESEFPTVDKAFRFYKTWAMWMEYDDRSMLEEHMAYADPNLLDFFSLHLLKGNPETALQSPNSMIITETVAEKYFGTKDPLGEKVIVHDEEAYEITGVMADIPGNTHFDFDIFMSMPKYVNDPERFGWGVNEVVTYVLLQKGASPDVLESQISGKMGEWFPDILLAGRPVPYASFAEAGNYLKYPLMPVRDIHLHSHRKNELAANGDILYVRLFLIIGLFMLILACVNFANLATARSATRAKEVGIRKTIGAGRGGLIIQFMGESSLITVIGTLLAVITIHALLPWFNQLTGKELAINTFYTLRNILILGGIGLTTTLLAGIYPAFVLSAFRPVQVLKGTVRTNIAGANFRNGLVVFQFLITVGLIAGTMIVGKQLHFLQNKQLGFEADQIYVLYDVNENGKLLQEEFRQFPEISNSTMTVFFPTKSHEIQQLPLFRGTTMGAEKNVLCQLWNVDEHYIPTLEIDLLQGRNFSGEMGLEGNSVILNEAAVREFGFADPVGQQVSFGNGEQVHTFNVVGVVEDFYFESLRYAVKPVLLLYHPLNIHLAFRAKTDNWSELIGKVQHTLQDLAPEQTFHGGFLNESMGDRYHAETRLAAVVRVFTGLTVLIACMGLFGLATFIAQQRTREIGIRKVLGASVAGLAVQLSKEFVRLVLIATLIAIPLAWYFSSEWLQHFAHRISIPVWMFVLAGFFAMGIAILTVSVQSIRTASINPAAILKNE